MRPSARTGKRPILTSAAAHYSAGLTAMRAGASRRLFARAIREPTRLHNRYQIAPVELVKIEREARKQGLDIAGFYHSHPDHPAQWSKTDFEEAHWLGCCTMITEVARGHGAITNSFLLAGHTEEDKRFEPQTIEIN